MHRPLAQRLRVGALGSEALATALVGSEARATALVGSEARATALDAISCTREAERIMKSDSGVRNVPINSRVSRTSLSAAANKLSNVG